MTVYPKRLKELRAENNLTQEELGKLLGGLKKQLICYYEKGQREPSVEILVRTANVFNVSVDYLLGLSNNRQTSEAEWEKIRVEKEKLKNLKIEISKLLSNI